MWCTLNIGSIYALMSTTIEDFLRKGKYMLGLGALCSVLIMRFPILVLPILYKTHGSHERAVEWCSAALKNSPFTFDVVLVSSDV